MYQERFNNNDCYFYTSCEETVYDYDIDEDLNNSQDEDADLKKALTVTNGLIHLFEHF